MPRQKRPSTPQESTSSKRRKTRSDTNIQGRSKSQVNLDPVVLSHIPLGSLSTVSDIVDVDGNRNCGFRTLAVFLGRPQTDHSQVRPKLLLYKMASNRLQLLNWGKSEQTLDELQANIDWDGSNCRDWPQCWLTVPESGRLVANCYYVRAFVLFSSNGSYTFFPERELAIDDLANIIAIVHIGAHYMSVALNARNGAVVPPPIFETTHRDQWIQMMIISNNWKVEDQKLAPPKENEQEEGEATGEQKDKDDAASDNYENDAADHYEADDGDHYKTDAGDYDDDDAGDHEADAGDLEDDVDEWCEGDTGDEKDEAVDYEDDTGDDDDDDSSDHQEFHHHSQKVEDHHLPRKFIQDQKNPRFNFYLGGVKTADGVSEKKRPRVGIAFSNKSIECIYLVKFLKTCGVSGPKVRQAVCVACDDLQGQVFQMML